MPINHGKNFVFTNSRRIWCVCARVCMCLLGYVTHRHYSDNCRRVPLCTAGRSFVWPKFSANSLVNSVLRLHRDLGSICPSLSHTPVCVPILTPWLLRSARPHPLFRCSLHPVRPAPTAPTASLFAAYSWLSWWLR
jgi:hypothetical protein